MTREVVQGARISEGDLGTVSLPEGYKNAIPAAEADALVGQSATTRLLPGMVLMPSMVSKKAGVADDQTQLTIPVDASPFVRSMQPGAQLALAVGGGDGSGRRNILAELVSVGSTQESGLTGSGSNALPIVVSVDISCLGVVSQAIQDKAVTPALIGGSGGGAVLAKCGA